MEQKIKLFAEGDALEGNRNIILHIVEYLEKFGFKCTGSGGNTSGYDATCERHIFEK